MIRLSCSQAVEEKVNMLLAPYSDQLKSGPSILLIERGYEDPGGMMAIVFDPLDYVDAVEWVTRLLVERDADEVSDTLTGFANDRFVIIQPEDIIFIQASRNEIICQTTAGDYILKQPLYHYEKILKDKGIIRINKSQLVNMMQVEEIIPWFNSRFVLSMRNQEQLEVSKKYAATLRKQLGI